MDRGIRMLRLAGLALAGSVIAGCAAGTLTAQGAVAGIPVAALLVGAGALMLACAVLVWRQRQTSHHDGPVRWSVTADGPGARDGEFALSPGVARVSGDGEPVAEGGEAPGWPYADASTETAPVPEAAAERATAPHEADPEAELDAEPEVVEPASDEVPTRETEWWFGEEEPSPRAGRADAPESTWFGEAVPVDDDDDATWFEDEEASPPPARADEAEPTWFDDLEAVRDVGDAAWLDANERAGDVDEYDDEDDLVDPPYPNRR